MEEPTRSLLTKQQALKFLGNKLDIPDHNVSETDKRLLLDRIIGRWYEVIPFHSVKQVSLEEPRSAPTEQEAVDDVLSGIGGLCGTQNVGMYHVLLALGYNVYFSICAVMGKDQDHAAVLVYNLETDGDIFLVDVGTGHPTFKAIQLKSKDGYTHDTGLIKESFLTYKYVKHGDTYKRYHLTRNGKDANDRQYPNIDSENWAEYLTVWLEPKSFSYIKQKLDGNIYSDMQHKFNRYFIVCKYPNKRFVGLRNSLVRKELSTGSLTVNELSGNEAMVQYIKKEFPEITEQVINQGYNNWLIFQEEDRQK